MNCEELLAFLNEYVDGTADPVVCDEFEKHMASCNPCKVVVDNMRATITLYHSGQPYKMPASFHERLRGLLRRRWREAHAENL